MDINGINLDDLLLGSEDQTKSEISYPETVKGRVAHIDGDFLAYMASFDETITFEQMTNNLKVMIETLRLLSGSEKVLLHLTPRTSDKGKRYEYSLLKEYQGNRSGKSKPSQLENIRLYMANNCNGILHYDQEADDGMAQANYEAAKAGHSELSVIISKDKDLNICEGWHLNWDTGELFNVDDFGELHYNDKDKVKGTGHKWFWFQMLKGDEADNIPGLPELSGADANVYKPTADTLKCQEIIAHDKDEKKVQRAKDKLAARKAIKCGDKTAYIILENVNSDKEAYDLIRGLYERYVDTAEEKPVNRFTGKPLTAAQLFVSNGLLLWMRRTKSSHDFVDFIKEINAESQS